MSLGKISLWFSVKYTDAASEPLVDLVLRRVSVGSGHHRLSVLSKREEHASVPHGFSVENYFHSQLTSHFNTFSPSKGRIMFPFLKAMSSRIFNKCKKPC